MQRLRGFTLVELLVVLAIIGLLLSIAAPRYSGSTDRAKETVLKENLATLREAIDKSTATLDPTRVRSTIWSASAICDACRWTR